MSNTRKTKGRTVPPPRRTERVATLAVGDDNLTVTYDLARWSNDQATAVRDSPEGSISKWIQEFLLTVITSWDFLDDGGKPMPISHESLSLLPDVIRIELAKAIKDDSSTPFPVLSA